MRLWVDIIIFAHILHTEMDKVEYAKLNCVLTTHRLAYLCCQCFASLDMKLALMDIRKETTLFLFVPKKINQE